MIVGEAPGREEIKQGIPFCGRSGLLLDDALHKAGIHRTNIYITNVFKGDVGEGNPTPTIEQLVDHNELFLEELDDLVRPKRILTLGLVASKSFINTADLPKKKDIKMKDWVGKSFYSPWDKATIYPCYHPAYVLRGRRPDVVFSFYSVVASFVHHR